MNDELKNELEILEGMADYCDRIAANSSNSEQTRLKGETEAAALRAVIARVRETNKWAPITEFQRPTGWGCAACNGTHPIEVENCPEATKWREGDAKETT